MVANTIMTMPATSRSENRLRQCACNSDFIASRYVSLSWNVRVFVFTDRTQPNQTD
jgi:hypothetical protein